MLDMCILCFSQSPNNLSLYVCIRRKFSGKSKKWKSIFNLGRSVDSKGKLSRNGSVFIRAQGITGTIIRHYTYSYEDICNIIMYKEGQKEIVDPNDTNRRNMAEGAT